jgi:hypothetical protein
LLCPGYALSPGACLLPALHVILVHLKGITCRISWLTLHACVKQVRLSLTDIVLPASVALAKAVITQAEKKRRKAKEKTPP